MGMDNVLVQATKMILTHFFRSDKKETKVFITEERFLTAMDNLAGLELTGNIITSPLLD